MSSELDSVRLHSVMFTRWTVETSCAIDKWTTLQTVHSQIRTLPKCLLESQRDQLESYIQQIHVRTFHLAYTNHQLFARKLINICFSSVFFGQKVTIIEQFPRIKHKLKSLKYLSPTQCLEARRSCFIIV